jgi:hypothetical protein
VLSKLEFFETNIGRPDLAAEHERLLPALCQHLQSSSGDLVINSALGGTLGVCFNVKISGEQRFLKTHLPAARARASLAKEADILIRLYGRSLMIECFDVTIADGTTRLCLLMPALAPLTTPMQPRDAAAMAQHWSIHLAEYGPERLEAIEQYLTCAENALAAIAKRNLLDRVSIAEVRRLMSQLDDRLPSLPRVLCHGDFGPRNIMIRETELFAIDWEDSFWGVAGYDYLYWLTFMENRPFLKSDGFGRTGLEPDVERAILVLVVLLKSYLAVCSGAYLNHAVTIKARIAEILELSN